MPHPVQIGPQHYPSKRAAERDIQQVRDRYIDDVYRQPLRVIDESDHVFLIDLLARHHEAEVKTGGGIEYFFVAPAGRYGTFCFHIHRTDGTDTDFGFDTCINGPSPRGDRLSAMREAVSGRDASPV